ncbi:MAG: gliding motility-associated C-terminal domain-containing protein [Saprospiraceae bacterium]|nr:gliding motility-associated C-terminal domain-containing protein [Saprospiraceae bacterium]
MLRATILFYLIMIGMYSVEGQPAVHSKTNSSFFMEENVQIDFLSIIQTLQQNDKRQAAVISLPSSNGEKNYKALRNEVMADDISRAYPEMMTFDLYDEKQVICGALTTSRFGINCYVYSEKQPIVIHPANYQGDGVHVMEIGVQQESKIAHKCNSQNLPFIGGRDKTPSFFKGTRNDFQIGDKLLFYDLAIVCTGEFYVANGNNDAAVIMAITSSVNNITAIYKRDFSITLSVSTARIKLYPDPATDPFIPDDAGGDERTHQAGVVVTADFPNTTSYDFGHVFHTHKTDDGWSGGGVATLESVCDNATYQGTKIKNRGWSGSFSNNNYGWYQLAAHEFGHQFGATHTFNGTGGSCTDAISESTSFEIGSGTTIMSYDGSCDNAQNIPSDESKDNYFHGATIQQVALYIFFDEGGTCATQQNSGNDIPEVEANSCNATLKLPKGTPFYLRGSATDSNSSNLSYTWEQVDEDGEFEKPTQGLIGQAAADNPIAPLFRSFPPSSSPERYFPGLNVLSTTGANEFEVLPNVPREMNFLLTVRDNNTNGSAVGASALKIDVINAGPFIVTRPKGGETLMAGMTENIIWNTNGSNALCSKVRIKISLDGGLTYPIIAAENVAYSAGSFAYNMPVGFTNTSKARVMLECMDNECFKFFNVSPANFSISSSCIAPETLISPVNAVSFDQGDQGLNLGLTSNIGRIVTNFSGTLRTTDVAGNLIFLSSGSCEGPSNSNYNKVILFSVDVSGNYTMAHGGVFGTILNIYKGVPSVNSCANHVASSAVENLATGNISPGANLTTFLTANEKYYAIISSFSKTLPVLPSNYNITFSSKPANSNVYDGIIQPPGYTYTYVAVNTETNKITAYSPTSDFRTIGAGNYCVYGVVHLFSIDLNTWLDKSLLEVLTSGSCFLTSTNCKPVEVKSACIISDITPANQGNCVASTNKFTQELIITYAKAPTTGMLNVNGQTFNITSSPQTVTLSLDSDGLPVNVNAFFTASPGCKLTKNTLFTAPANCCPVSVELGADISSCMGETVMLDAGNSGVSFKWFRDGVEVATSKLLTVSTSGLYEVEVTDISGCAKKDKVRVTFNELPVINMMTTAQFCEGETYSITPMITGGQSYKWFKDNAEISGQTSNKLNITQAGTYKLEVTSSAGCKNTSTTIATSIKAPVVELGNSLQKCEGETTILNAGTDGIKYEWFRDGTLISGATQSTYNVVQTGVFSVIVTNTAQCKTNDQVQVNFFASPVVQDFPAVINACQGAPTILTAVASDYQTLQWYYDNNLIPGSNMLTLTANNSGTYAIEASNLAGCKTKKSTQLEIRSLPVVELGATDLVSCIGSPVVLNAGSDGTTYKWTKDGAGITNTTKTLTVNENGLYSVTVSNTYNCSTTDQIKVSFVAGPSLELNGDKTICEATSHVITATTNAINPVIKWYKDTELITGENTLSLNVMLSGTYEVVITGGTPPCDVRKSVKITVNPRPALNLGNDRTICEGDMLPVLNAGAGNTSFNWTLNGVALATSQTVTADKSGTYAVTVKNSFGCERTEQVKITIQPLPTLVMNDQYSLCKGSNLLITPETNGTRYEWRKNNTLIPAETGKTITLTTAGSYSFTSYNAGNCKKDNNFTVTERAIPVLDLGVNDTLCPDQSKTLNAGSHTQYKWSDNTTAATLNINAGKPVALTTSKYLVTVTNEFGCTSKDSISITLVPVVKANVASDKPGVCNGDPVKLTATGGIKYKWTDPDGGTLSELNDAITIASPTKTTTYMVEVSDGVCPDNKETKSIVIKVFEPVNVSAGSDTCVVIGKSIKLKASGGVSYDWDNKNLIVGASNVPDPLVKPVVETVFNVTITDANGCEFSDDVKVCVKEDTFKPVTIITPNGDGKNDELYFGGLSDYPDNTLRVFNRWGNLMFEAEGYQTRGQMFTGYRNGEKLPADTYYYILTFDNQVFKSALTIIWD